MYAVCAERLKLRRFDKASVDRDWFHLGECESAAGREMTLANLVDSYDC